MDSTATHDHGAASLTRVERTSDRDLVVTRFVNGSARLAFDAWTRPDLMRRWWSPKSFGINLITCEIDARTGGKYRFVFAVPGTEQTMAFFGRYVEVTAPERIVWTNEEGAEDGAVTTVTFIEKDAGTEIVLHDRYPSKEALDEAEASGSTSGFCEQFDQLVDLLADEAAGQR